MKPRLPLGSALGAVSLAAMTGLAACASETDRAAPAAAPTSTPADAARPAQTLPLPGDAPTDAAPAPSAHAANGALTWVVPPGWVEVEPSSSMRIAQYAVSGPAGEAECVVFYFGPRQGGDAAANAERWAGQFTQPDGRPSREVMIVTRLESTERPVQLVEITGTYDGGMTMTAEPASPKPGFMLLGAIADGPDAPWFFKFTGPEATVRAERDRFLSLLRSLRVAG